MCGQVRLILKHLTFQSLAAVIVAENKEDRTYSCLDLMRSPKMRKLAILSGTTWLVFYCSLKNTLCFQTLYVMETAYSELLLQVWSCFYVLRYQFEHNRLWTEPVPNPVHIWCNRDAIKTVSLSVPRQTWPQVQPGGHAGYNRGLYWHHYPHS